MAWQTYRAFCPMWAYSRCNYKTTIKNLKDEQEWRDHMRNHFRDDDEDIPGHLRCWFTACPHSQPENAFKSRDLRDTDANLDNFDEFLGHTSKHFQNEPWLRETDLHHGDVDMLFTAWLKNEIYDSYFNPQIPRKQDEFLPDDVFVYFAGILEEQGYDSTERDLTSHEEVQQRAMDT